jgi:hypothetical protein
MIYLNTIVKKTLLAWQQEGFTYNSFNVPTRVLTTLLLFQIEEYQLESDCVEWKLSWFVCFDETKIETIL